MNSLRRHMKQLSLIMVILMSFATTFSVSAHAGMVGTGEMIQQQQTDLDRQQLLDMLDDQNVKDKLAQMGVSEAQVAERIQNLTPAELADFEQQLAEAPAGKALLALSCCSFWYSSSPTCCVPRTCSPSSIAFVDTLRPHQQAQPCRQVRSPSGSDPAGRLCQHTALARVCRPCATGQHDTGPGIAGPCAFLPSGKVPVWAGLTGNHAEHPGAWQRTRRS